MRNTFLSFLLVSLLLAACGAPNVEAPRNPVHSTVPLRIFPRQDWLLNSTKAYLWKTDMTPNDASRALSISDEMDKLDGSALPLVTQQNELDAQMAPLEDALEKSKKQLEAPEKDYKAAVKKTAEAKKKLDTEKKKPTPDPKKVTELTKALEQATAKEAELKKALEAKKPDMEKLRTDIKAQEEKLAPFRAKKDALAAQQQTIFAEGQKLVDEIVSVTEWYQQTPTPVSFRFLPNGKVAGTVANWNFGDNRGAQTFSTEAENGRQPTLVNLTYTELGGVFEFDLLYYVDADQKVLQDKFHFRMARIKYDYPDGRNFFGGEISRTRYDEKGNVVSVRYGMAKMIDKSN